MEESCIRFDETIQVTCGELGGSTETKFWSMLPTSCNKLTCSNTLSGVDSVKLWSMEGRSVAEMPIGLKDLTGDSMSRRKRHHEGDDQRKIHDEVT